MTTKTLKRGPKGGVFYVAGSGARVYVDRSSLPNDALGKAVSPRYRALDAAALGAFCLVILPLILR